MLVNQGLAPSRQRAQALILAGKVFLGEKKIDKPGIVLQESELLSVKGEALPYVSRGGIKLAGALDALAINPQGMVAADFGASTGGFTDCLLQRGALRVYAIDVGYGQLHEKLRSDPRVICMERTNARSLNATTLSEQIDIVVIDASFIGLGKLLPAAKEVTKRNGYVLAMVKPQFEVGPQFVGKKGVVRDEVVRKKAITQVIVESQALGFRLIGQQDSPIRGPEGNLETFIYLEKNAYDHNDIP